MIDMEALEKVGQKMEATWLWQDLLAGTSKAGEAGCLVYLDEGFLEPTPQGTCKHTMYFYTLMKFNRNKEKRAKLIACYHENAKRRF